MAKPKPDDIGPRILAKKSDKNTKDIKATFGGQHSLHGMFGASLERIGGQDFIDEWARNNPTVFMEMMMRLAPPPAQNQPAGGGGGNSLTLNIHPGLQSGPLDAGLTIEHDK